MIYWIMEYITTIGISVLVNRIPIEAFKAERDIRQEDLFLRLFLLFMLNILDIFIL